MAALVIIHCDVLTLALEKQKSVLGLDGEHRSEKLLDFRKRLIEFLVPDLHRYDRDRLHFSCKSASKLIKHNIRSLDNLSS